MSTPLAIPAKPPSIGTRLLVKQLKNIESLMKHRESILEDEYFDKYNPIFQEIPKLLKKERALLYGGLAINELLPKKHKFYGPHELPDFDVFSTNAKTLAKKAVAYFHKKGYTLASYSEALHENTYKVLVSGLQVLDISQISKEAYAILEENKQLTSYGIYTVNPQYLRMTMHLLLSQPKDVHRWMKIFERIVAFYEIYPPTPLCKKPVLISDTNTSKDIISVDRDIYDKIHKYTSKWIKSNQYVVFSPEAWIDHLPKRNTLTLQLKQLFEITHTTQQTDDGFAFTPIEFIVDVHSKTSLDKILQEWFDKLKVMFKGNTELLSSIEQSSIIDNDILPKHVIVYLHKKPLLIAYEAPACVSYTTLHQDMIDSDMRVASIQTVMRMYIQKLLSAESSVRDLERLECMINLLTTLYIQNLTNSRNPFLKSFVMQCYGHQPGIITLKRMRYMRVKQ